MDVYSATDILCLGPRAEDESMWTNAERVEVWMSFLYLQDGLIKVLCSLAEDDRYPQRTGVWWLPLPRRTASPTTSLESLVAGVVKCAM
jgi:hypothetical protein